MKHGDDYRSLAAEDDLFTVDLARALALFAEPKRGGPAAGGQARHPADRRRPTAAPRCRCSKAATARTSPTARPTPRSRRAPIPATLSLEDARGLHRSAARRAAARTGRPPRRRERRDAAQAPARLRPAQRPPPRPSRKRSAASAATRRRERRAKTAGAQDASTDARPHRRRRSRRFRGRVAGGLARRAGHAVRDAAGRGRPRCTRPTGSPSSSAAIPSAATSSITPSAC